MVYLAPLPLFIAGLAFGSAAVTAAAVVATALIAALSGSIALPAAFLVSAALPVIVLVRQALLSRQAPDGSAEWYPPGRLLVLLAGLGMAAVASAFTLALAWGEDGGLETMIHRLILAPMAEVFRSGGGLGDAGPDDEATAVASLIFPGVVAVSWLMMILVNGLLAQSLLGRFDRLIRPPLRMSAIELPAWAPLVLALTVAGSLGADGLARFLLVNLAIVAALPFLFAGLAVVHAIAAQQTVRIVILVLFYMFLIIEAWPMLVLVVALGVIEQWAGLRRRYAAGGPDRGDV